MNELSRHIEILLLNNDCVIVPGFGGFMAHHSAATYVDDAGLFYPPQRTLGFNPLLQLNDSLLAQSYVESYDISYPEAVRKIESEVEEIRQTISLEGSYEFHGIGIINLLSNGQYDFLPCTAGLLTPSLYALDSFAIDYLKKEESKPLQTVSTQDTTAETEEPATLYVETEDEPVYEEEGLHISYAALRNILAVAMLLLFFVFASIPAGIGSGDVLRPNSTKVQKCSVIDTEIISSFMKQEPKTNVTNEASKENVSTPVDKVNNATVKEKKVEEQRPVHENYFTIVLASQVSKKGADEFVSVLQKKGLKEANVHGNGSSRKVIFGKYHSQDEAYNAISSLKKDYSEFSQAWPTEIHD